MTARLYVKRGGAASAETEVMLAAADRKGSPVFDGTTPKVNLGMRYADGESSQGTYVLTDPLAEIPSDTYRIPPHGLVTLTEDASGDELWLARVRNSQISAGRRAVSVPKNEVEWEVTTVDCNIDLTGNHFVHPWERPAETDIDRIIALQAHILNGDSSTAAHHRKSTVITAAIVGDGHLLQDGTTHTDDSLTNLEAKTYPPGTVARDVLEDISEAAGKTYGVVIHHTGGTSHLCLLYVQELDHETYDSAIKISQNIADLAPDDPDTPVFAPIWDRGPGKQIENDHVISGLIDIYGGTADNPLTVFVDQSADDETPHEYWTDAYFDSDSKTEAQATFRANQILASRRPPGHTTHQLSIKMHPEQTRLLCAGMSVSVKSAVVTGAPLSYVKRRVSELRWELAPDGDWFAHLDLDRPIRVRRGSLQAPQAPDTGTPGTPPTAPTDDYVWTFPSSLNDDSDTYYWHYASWGSTDVTGWDDTAFPGSAHAWAGYGGSVTDNLPITAGVVYTISADVAQRQSDANAWMRAEWYGASGLLQTDYIAGPGVSVVTPTHYSIVVTAPAGSTHVRLRTKTAVGETMAFDNVYVQHGGSGGTAGTPSTSGPTTVGGTGEGVYSDSGEYVPVGSVLEHSYITEGGPYHDADQIAVDPIEGLPGVDDVQEALEEIVSALGTTPVTDGAFAITTAPEGGWGRITKHNVVSYNGYTYIGYVDGSNGDAQIAVVQDTAPDTVITTINLHAALEKDDHSAPSLLVRDSDHKLLAAYCGHSEPSIYTKLSTTSLDTDPDLGDGFAAEVNRDSVLGGSSYTFANLIQLTGEVNDPIWLIYREGANAEWFRSISTDSGATFAAPTKILTESGETPYLKAVLNGDSRIDFVSNELNPSGGNASVWHFYYEGSAFHASDGTTITLPIDSSKATLVTGDGLSNLSFMDIAIGTDTNPVIAYADITDIDHHAYFWTKWDGSAWITPAVMEDDAGAGIDVATKTYSPHVALDGDDPTIVYVSRQVSGRDVLYRYTTTDDGATWTQELISSSTSSDAIRPMSWAGHPTTLDVVWMEGTYTGFTSWTVGIWGVGETLTTPTLDQLVKVSSNDTTPGYLNGKLVAGANVSLTEVNDGADETLSIAATIPDIENLATAETDTTLRLAPDGAGGVAFVTTTSGGSDTAWIVDPGTPSYSGTGPVTVALTSVFGIDGSGNPYYNATGVTDGEEAALVWDSTTGSYSLRPYYP